MPDHPHSVFRPPDRDGGRMLRTAADAPPERDTITPGRLTGFDRIRHRILDPFRRWLTAGGNGQPAVVTNEFGAPRRSVWHATNDSRLLGSDPLRR